ncbi:MoaC family-domain-containing protein [Aspergillus falconensis]
MSSMVAMGQVMNVPTYLLGPRVPTAAQTRLYHCQRSTPQSEEPSNREKNLTSLPTSDDPDLPHLNRSQNVHMTLIDEKPVSKRLATATCLINFSNRRPWELLRQGPGSRKGDVFSIARIAGITAAKKTPDIVPLCHPGLGLTGAEVDVKLLDPSADGGEMKHGAMHVTATVSCVGRTGVEMEAMTATMGAALTVYDMLKAVDKGMVIGGVKLLEKMGGKSGHWVREEVVKDE